MEVVLTILIIGLFWPKLGCNRSKHVVEFADGLLLLPFHASDPDTWPIYNALTPDRSTVLTRDSALQTAQYREADSIPSDNGASLCRVRQIYASLSPYFQMPFERMKSLCLRTSNAASQHHGSVS